MGRALANVGGKKDYSPEWGENKLLDEKKGWKAFI
jgi:hypothetical protein